MLLRGTINLSCNPALISLYFLCALQHALSMAGGLVTPPLLIGLLADDPATKSYLIQAALLVCGIMTFVQVTATPLIYA